MEKFLRPERFNCYPEIPTASQSWAHWLKTFENFISQSEITEDRKLNVLINFLSYNVYEYILECSTYQSAIEILQNIYNPKINEIYARHLLANRKQRKEEGIEQYLQELRLLSQNCNFRAVDGSTYQDECIRDAFISGIMNPNIQQTLLEKSSLTLKETEDISLSLESAQKGCEGNVTSFQTTAHCKFSSTSISAKPLDKEADTDSPSTLAAVPINFEQKCFYCGGKSHTSENDCPAKDATCSGCKKKGHYEKMCRLMEAKVTVKMESEEVYNENEVDIDEHSEIKEEALDLTVHCEPLLIEEEDDLDNSESLDLDGSVDPLDFLEVDQTLLEESGEENLLTVAKDEAPPEIEIKTENVSTESSELSDVTTNLSQEITEAENVEGTTATDSDHSTHEERLRSRPSSRFTTCEQCGQLKIPKNFDSELFDGAVTENNLFFCDCADDEFLCTVCNKFVKEMCFESHIKRHKREKKHKCQICGKAFLHPVLLRNHEDSHLDEKSYVCDICGKTFKMAKSLKYHRVLCLNKKHYQCHQCGESFPLKRALFNHLRVHEKALEDDSFNCEICCIVFDNSSSKKEHIMQVHVAAQRFVCETCGEAFITESAMKRHTVKHSRSYPCKMCDATFSTRRDLLMHRVQHRARKDLRCRICDKEFEQITAYTEHKLSQSCNEDRTTCGLCEKTFKDKTALKKHILVHTPLSERSVLCEICNKGFCGNAALKKHIRLIHADSRPYTCEFCSKSFNQLCKLKYHIVIHASDKPVTCDICNKAFSNEKDVKIHMRVHTGEKPFKCNVCDKRFRQRGHVKTHQLVHTRERPFNCQFCNKSFGLTSSLKKHTKLHTTKVLVTSSQVDKLLVVSE